MNYFDFPCLPILSVFFDISVWLVTVENLAPFSSHVIFLFLFLYLNEFNQHASSFVAKDSHATPYVYNTPYYNG